MRQYYLRNKEKLLENKKEYYSNNKEIILKQKKEYQKNHKKELEEYRKQYYSTQFGRAKYLLYQYKTRDEIINRGECTINEQ